MCCRHSQLVTLKYEKAPPIKKTLSLPPFSRNCMFRALSDQIHGSSDQHLNMRADVVDFMRKHRDDFEPFLVDETSYDRHLQLLSENGTYGNCNEEYLFMS